MDCWDMFILDYKLQEIRHQQKCIVFTTLGTVYFKQILLFSFEMYVNCLIKTFLP